MKERDELHAAIEARRELGDDYEPQRSSTSSSSGSRSGWRSRRNSRPK